MAKQILNYVSFFFVFLLLGSVSSESSGDAQIRCEDLPGKAVFMGCEESIRKDRPKTPPSPKHCCEILKIVGMKCVCYIVTKEVEGIYDMEKLVYVAAACGRPLTPGSQCGSYRVPGA